jgi:hypothetical protein
MKIKTEDLTGPALDWAVAKCAGLLGYGWRKDNYVAVKLSDGRYERFTPSFNWSHGGPIIEIEEIGIRRNAPCSDGRQWEAFGSITAKGAGYRWGYGRTPLIAAMRCFVASKLGEEVDIPDDLLPRDYGLQTEFHRETA